MCEEQPFPSQPFHSKEKLDSILFLIKPFFPPPGLGYAPSVTLTTMVLTLVIWKQQSCIFFKKLFIIILQPSFCFKRLYDHLFLPTLQPYLFPGGNNFLCLCSAPTTQIPSVGSPLPLSYKILVFFTSSTDFLNPTLWQGSGGGQTMYIDLKRLA